MSTNDNEVAQMLREGRDFLATGKWGRGTLADEAGNRCILGALNLSGCLAETYFKAWRALANKLPEGYESLLYFNDAPSTTLPDVLNLFDKALAELGAL